MIINYAPTGSPSSPTPKSPLQRASALRIPVANSLALFQDNGTDAVPKNAAQGPGPINKIPLAALLATKSEEESQHAEFQTSDPPNTAEITTTP